MRVAGSTAIITGAASGIGQALARDLIARDATKLVLLDIDRDGLERFAATLPNIKLQLLTADVSDCAALQNVFAGFVADGLMPDFLFNNAGIPAGTPSWPDTDLERIRAIIEINLLGILFATRLAIPLMAGRGGSILNTASVSGLRPYMSGAIYAASKAGVIMFTQSCRDLAKSAHIRVNAICPGIVHTPFLEKTGSGGQMAAWLAQRIAKKEILQPAEVARAAIDLACDETCAGEYRIIEAPP